MLFLNQNQSSCAFKSAQKNVGAVASFKRTSSISLRKYSRRTFHQAIAQTATPEAKTSIIDSIDDTLIVEPEDFTLMPGELSYVNRKKPTTSEDVYQTSKDFDWRFSSEGYLREILATRVYDVAIQTPMEEAKKLSQAIENTIYLKREDLQSVYSFKLRGAYNKMAKLSKEALARGVITSSAGNHAQGVALSAARLKCKAIICMPVSTPDVKVANVRKLGGIVELVGESYQETQSYAVQRAAKDGLTFVAPYDDPHTIAGQGTIGTEIYYQVPNLEDLEAIFVPVGGGGLIAGIAAYIKTLDPKIKIIGVEPTGANAMAQSLARGERVTLSKVDSFADGVAVKKVGQETFRLCRDLVDGVVLVDNSSIAAAIKDVFNETRAVLEPSGALSVAGAKAYLKHHKLKGKTVVAITSGANINFSRLALVAEMAEIGSKSEATLATTIPEQPGAFRKFLDTAIGAAGELNLTEFKYRCVPNKDEGARIFWSATIRSPEHLAEILKRLNEADMPTDDLSELEVAQLHLRHMFGTGGSKAARMQDEKIFQVIFPEVPGALKRFLSQVSPRWNITMFHYRDTGNRESSVLLGVQIPKETASDFKIVTTQLRPDFEFKSLDDVFNKVLGLNK
uniref:Threonine dehydratase n=1 Tax=Polytomella parva TaxID=51329 RepID=A0A7S0YKJ5_9CHLO|nr:threonine deaminase (THRD) chloroplastic [Polytomella parva]